MFLESPAFLDKIHIRFPLWIYEKDAFQVQLFKLNRT